MWGPEAERWIGKCTGIMEEDLQTLVVGDMKYLSQTCSAQATSRRLRHTKPSPILPLGSTMRVSEGIWAALAIVIQVHCKKLVHPIPRVTKDVFAREVMKFTGVHHE
jgi:hypothetical protein